MFFFLKYVSISLSKEILTYLSFHLFLHSLCVLKDTPLGIIHIPRGGDAPLISSGVFLDTAQVFKFERLRRGFQAEKRDSLFA